MYKPANDLTPGDRFQHAGEPHTVTGPLQPGAMFAWMLHVPVHADSGLVYTIILTRAQRVLMVDSDQSNQPGAST